METKLREKILYSFGDVGCSFIWTFTSSFLVLYYTDSVQVSAAFVGTMMLVTRTLDGGSDILMGIVIEKTNTRFGKARPWVLFGCVPFALALILAFNVPSGIDTNLKSLYIYATYIFMTVVCYTAVNLAYNAMLPRITFVQHERAVISTYRVILTLIMALAISFATPPLLAALGGTGTQGPWSSVSGIYAVLAVVFLLLCFFGSKEKVPLEKTDGSVKQKTPIMKTFGKLFRIRYFYISVILTIVMAFFNGVIGGYIYYARDVLRNEGLFGVMSACTMLPILLCAPFTPALFRKVGKRNAIQIGMMLGIAGSIMQLLSPYNVIVVIIGMSLRAVGLAPIMTASSTLTGDIVDYMQWKTSIRAEGIVSSISSFGAKIGTGLGSAILGWFLAMGGYNGALTTQTQSAINAEIAVVGGIPLVLCIITFAGMWFWDIDRYRPEIDTFLNKANRVQEKNP
ncbi:MFS transporter [Spirochaetia bacterium]|nr:MFS transporter [Spirochaetia bacterium]